jgi:hypothetical protein
VWWLWQVRTEPLWGPFGVGSTLAQWAIALGLFIALNNWFVRHTPRDLPPGRPAGGAVSSIP